jgi:hypothetical protein
MSLRQPGDTRLRLRLQLRPVAGRADLMELNGALPAAQRIA